MATRFEVRSSQHGLGTRSAGSTTGEGLTLFGYAARFDSPTEIRDYTGTFLERIAPGAFAESLAERAPILQYQHGKDPAVGTVPIGVFTEIREDRTGLYVEAALHDNPTTLPVRQAVASGALSGMSFRFEVTAEYWRDSAGQLLTDREVRDLLWNPGDRGPLIRTLTAVRLYEAGPVSQPAYRDTSVGIRSGTDTADIDRLRLLILKGAI